MMFLFQDFEFMLFFIALFALYWLLPQKLKNPLLLLASYVFYCSWNWKLLSLILISTYIDFFCGMMIPRAKTAKSKKWFLLLSLITNLSLLGFFKYFNFFVENLVALLNSVGIHASYTALNIILPIGISFYTFQTLSYTIDIYRGKLSPTKNLIDFSLFVAYFPQLIAGPIERARDLIPKLQAKKSFKEINFSEGAYLFVYGFFKKAVIADSIGMLSDKMFSLADPTGAQVVIGALAFAIQIYCDFSGYSNMARGLSRFLGVELSVNFNLPYFSKNPAEFWRRWHMTLSSWVKDYIYIPLGGNRTFFFGIFPLFVAWFLMGLWHGAAWHFVLWGVYWAALVIGYRAVRKGVFGKVRIKNKVLSYSAGIGSVLLTFYLACYGWIIFRSQSLAQLFRLTKASSAINFAEFFSSDYYFLYFVMLFFFVYELIQYLMKDQLFIHKKNFYYQMIFYMILFFIYIQVGAQQDVNFLYFQF